MSQERDNALAKVEQARHSLELMRRVWDSQTPVLAGKTAKQEFDYYLSDFLNACYSTGCMLDVGGKRNPLVLKFWAKHPDFYQSSSYGKKMGYRHENTHGEPLKTEAKHYDPPNGDSVTFTLEKQPPIDGDEVTWTIKDVLHFPGTSQEAIKRCSEHLRELEDFVTRNFP